jgi:hypothetical protein
VETIALLTVLLPVVAGAIIGFVPNWLLEGRKDKAARRGKWSDALYVASTELLGSARRSEHLIEQLASGESSSNQALRLDEEQQRMRVALEQVLMLGNAEVQRAARRLVHHTWAQRVLMQKGEDPHPRTGGMNPKERTMHARRAYYKAVRRQLRVPSADEWAPGITDEPETIEEIDH